jgi:aspartate 1-decarboxylase
MLITFRTAKLCRSRVTPARLDYEGGITIEQPFIEPAGIVPFQPAHINSVANAVHWETCALPSRV